MFTIEWDVHNTLLPPAGPIPCQSKDRRSQINTTPELPVPFSNRFLPCPCRSCAPPRPAWPRGEWPGKSQLRTCKPRALHGTAWIQSRAAPVVTAGRYLQEYAQQIQESDHVIGIYGRFKFKFRTLAEDSIQLVCCDIKHLIIIPTLPAARSKCLGSRPNTTQFGSASEASFIQGLMSVRSLRSLVAIFSFSFSSGMALFCDGERPPRTSLIRSKNCAHLIG